MKGQNSWPRSQKEGMNNNGSILPPLAGQRREHRARHSLDLPDTTRREATVRSFPLLKRRKSLMASDLEPRIVKFVKNGDKFFEGVKVNVSTRIVKNWEVLLSDLSTRIQLPAGVRNIYTPENGHIVTRLSQLEHQGMYVCASTEPFKRIDYGRLKNPKWRSSARPRNRDNYSDSIFAKNYSIDLSASTHSSGGNLLNKSISSSLCESQGPLLPTNRPRKLKPLRQPSMTAPDERLEEDITPANSPVMNKIEQKTVSLTIFRNGPLPRERVNIVLEKDSSWDGVKDQIGREFQSINGYLRLFTVNGTPVNCLDQLWGAGSILIAAGGERFDISTFMSGEGKETSSTSVIITSSPAEQSQDAQEESTGGLVLNIDQVNNIQQKNKKEETDSGPSEHLDNPTPAESPLNSTNGSCLEPEQQELVPSKETVEITATMTQSETISREATEQENQDTSNHYITNTNNPLPDQSHCDSTSPKTPHRAVSPLEKRPRTLSLIGEKYSDLLSYNRPMSASSDETPIGKNYRAFPHLVLPKTPQSDISLGLGAQQSMIDMMLPKLSLLHMESTDSTLGSESIDGGPYSEQRKRSVGIQTDFTSDQLSTIIDVNQFQDTDTQEDEAVTSPTNEKPTLDHHSNKQTRDKYEMGSEIHEGRYASVRTCTHKTSKQEYFVRVINKAKIFWNDDPVLREIKILTKLRHKHVTMVIDQWETSNEICMVMEQIEGSDLYDCIDYCKVFSEADTVNIMYQLGLALVYLHANSIVHRDIRLENLFLTMEGDERWVLKLGGFSLATTVTEPLCRECGDKFFRAPEMLAGTGYSTKVDVWAAGVLCYLLLSGTMPYLRKSQAHLFTTSNSKRLFPASYWNEVSENAKELITHLLQPNPQQRFTSSEMLQHPWINEQPKVGREDKTQQLMEHVKTQAAESIASVLVLSVTALDHSPMNKVLQQS